MHFVLQVLNTNFIITHALHLTNTERFVVLSHIYFRATIGGRLY